MRKKQLEITKREALDAILQRARIGRLATIGADGYPYITPLNYVYWQGAIYIHCALTGEKLDNIIRDPRVCFTVDIPLSYLDLDYFGDYPEGCRVHQFYHCVIIRGRAEIVDEPREKSGALNALVASHEPAGRRFQPITPDTDGYRLCAVVAVRIESITGKADLAQKKSVEEKQKLSDFFYKRGRRHDEETATLIREQYSP